MSASGSTGRGGSELPRVVITLGASIREGLRLARGELEPFLVNAILRPSDTSIPTSISEKIPLVDLDDEVSEDDRRALSDPQCAVALWRVVRDQLVDIGEDAFIDDCPTWFSPVMAWVARHYIERMAKHIEDGKDLSLNLEEVPRRSALKSIISSAKKDSSNIQGRDRSSLSRTALPPVSVATVPRTTDSSSSDLETGGFSKWSKKVRDVHLLVGATPSGDMLYNGNAPAGSYIRWRTQVLDKVSEHPVEDVRIAAILHCISEPEKTKVKRQLRTHPVATADELLSRLDKEHLTVPEKAALVNQWVDVCQRPGESAYSYVQRFEELVHLRSVTHPEHGQLHDMDLLSMLRRGFTDPICRGALPLIDPTGKMSYDGYKNSVLAFVSSLPQSASLSVSPGLSVPGTNCETSTFRSKRDEKAARQKPKVSDDSPIYSHVRSAITRELGIADKACLRCGKEGHFARDCTSTSVFRWSERCKTCGGLSTVGGKPHQCKVSKRRVTCTSCGQGGHMCSVCPTAKTAGGSVASHQTAAQQLSSLFPVSSASSQTARAEVHAGQSVSVQFPKLPEVSLRLGHDHVRAFCDTRALVDSGANASLMRDHLVQYFVDNGIIRPEDVVALKVPISVGGISAVVTATHLARVVACSGTLRDIQLEFLVCADVENQIILGANMYPKLGIALTAGDTQIEVHNFDSVADNPGTRPAKVARAYIEEQLEPLIIAEESDSGRLQLMAHVGVFRKAAMMPFRSPPRRRSETDDRIIHHRLTSMARENKVSRCRETEVMMICPVVIVDKEGSSCLRRFPDSKVDERYRITLDLRVVNSLSLAYDSANAFVLLPSKNAHNVDTVAAFDTKSYRQSEITALRRLRAVPAHYTTYYKLDLRDAYSSVAIDQSLQRCFGVLSYDDSNQPCYWCYRVLPQGWQWSSLLFGSAMEFMMALIQDRFRDLKIPAVAIHCKDDVIIASCCEKHAARALACAKDCFLEYSFVVNEAKTYGPSTSVTFFGYNLKTGCVTPKPKKEFTQATADLALADWHGNCSRAARLSWLRRWCGIFQCFKAHMNHASMDALHHMQRALSCFQKPENEERVDPGLPDSVVEAFRTLCTMYLQNGVVPLFFGLLEETLGTAVLTDANAKSYAGIILRAVRSTPATEGLQNSVSVPVQFPAASELFSSVPDIPYVLLPVKFVGAPFPPTEQRKSSTYRERYAVLDTVWQGRDVLAGEVVCLVDNANTMKTWSDVQETLHGVLLTKFENLQRCAHRFCWMPRDGAPRWPDLLARSIESCHSTDVGMDTDGDACVIDCEAVTCRTAAAGQQTDDVLCMLPVPSLLRRAFAAWKDNSDLSEQCSIALEPEQARGWLKAVQDTDKQCEKLRVLVGKGLSKFNIDDTGILRIGIKYVLPKRFGPSLAEQVHRSHGHCGAKQTLDIICRDFFCFRIAHSVQKVVSKCYCQYVRARRGPITPPVASLRDTVQVNDRWFMDTVGPLPTSADHDYKHVLSIQDAASSLVIFLPLCSTTTATIIETLESRVFSLLSPPRSITVDNASSFQAVAFQSWAASWGIKVYFNPPYAAHRNGSLERQHGVLKQVLKSLCKGNVAQWPRFLPVAQRRCNSRAIYGDNTPHQLYFGLKDSAFFSRRFEDIAPSLDADSVRFEAKRRSARREADIRRIHQALDEAEAEVLLKLTNSKKIVSRRRVFQVGQKVLKWCGPKPALGVSWSGPHVVTECCGPNKMTYRLSDGTTQESHNLCLYH